jgi:hypothetical protein
MTKEQYYQMIRLNFILHGTYGVVKHISEDERNKMYRKYIELRNLYHKSRGVNNGSK